MSRKQETFTSAVDAILKKVPNIIAIYRFGSFGTVYEKASSDLDLAILTDRPMDVVQRFELAQHIASIVNRDVDLIDLRRASTVLQFQIIGNGERIYCSDDYISELFADTVFSMYQRLNEERKYILADIKDRGSVM